MYENELSAVSHFKLPAPAYSAEPITCGNINRTFAVYLTDGTKYILQSVNVNVFKKPYELMDNVKKVCDFLKKKVAAAGGDPDRETLTYADTDDGTMLYVDENGRYWRMSKYIDAVSYQSIARPELFYNAAKAFGSFQSQLADYPADTLFETIPNFHNTVKRYEAFLESEAGCKLPERLKACEAEREFLKARESLAHVAVDALASGKMPLRVTHNDTKLNNVLLDSVTDKALCVIDLDTVMPGSVLYDFGDAIRFGACTAAEDEPDTNKIALDLDLFEQFTRGFISGLGGALTEMEYELLPEGAMLLTYEQAMRFLTDYLNGDTYFKLNYPEHNIVRTRAQIALLRDMEKKLSEMRRIVRECR